MNAEQERPDPARPRFSVVIAAHNEEAVLGRCLTALLRGALPDEIEVVVVANGCRDATAEVARSAGVPVIETPLPGKAAALRLADHTCEVFPRLYLDADVELSIDAARRLSSALSTTGALACAPRPDYDVDGAGPIASRFYRAYHGLVSHGDTHKLSGAGAYMLTESGHMRAFPLPDLIADDAWVHRTFTREERLAVSEARCTVRPPRTVAAELRRRARTRTANRELATLGRPAQDDRLTLLALLALVRSRDVRLLDAACLVGVVLLDRLLDVLRRVRGATDSGWSTDHTSRQRLVPSPRTGSGRTSRGTVPHHGEPP